LTIIFRKVGHLCCRSVKNR